LIDGAYFLDSNPDVFSVILDYLRYKTLVISPGLAIEAVKVSTVPLVVYEPYWMDCF
jgi:hypothetical protein